MTKAVSDDGDASSHRRALTAIFNAALAAADPYRAVLGAVSIEHERMRVDDHIYDLASFNRILVIGAGKATARMAQAIELLLGDKISQGLIIVKEGHALPLNYIEQVEASHPVPNDAGATATRRILQLARAADENTLVICLLSGGASALLVSPVGCITLQDKQKATQLLLNAGATIAELNAVRKHLSNVKGGHLAQAVFPAQLLTLIVSDVIGDSPDVIASGPTVADRSTFIDACSVIEKYRLCKALPQSVVDYLNAARAGLNPETLKDSLPGKTVIVAGNHQALIAARDKAQELGFSAQIISENLQGEAREVALWLAQIARSELAQMKAGERRCLLFGGETTVTVRGKGRGGRNQELALAFAMEIEGVQGISLLSAGTDGTDGPTDAAGAMVDGSTASAARGLNIDPHLFLENNDSYAFFEQAISGAHLKIGPTGTNVMDIQIVLLCAPEEF